METRKQKPQAAANTQRRRRRISKYWERFSSSASALSASGIAILLENAMRHEHHVVGLQDQVLLFFPQLGDRRDIDRDALALTVDVAQDARPVHAGDGREV